MPHTCPVLKAGRCCWPYSTTKSGLLEVFTQSIGRGIDIEYLSSLYCKGLSVQYNTTLPDPLPSGIMLPNAG